MTVKKFNCIVKVGNKPNGQADTVVHKVNNLLSYTKYITEKYPKWSWMNVYNEKTREKISQYTQKNPPLSPWVEV